LLGVLSLLAITPARSSADGWEKVPGSALRIAAGADGSVWVVGTKRATGGFALLRWDGKDWEEVKGAGGVAVALDPQGVPWVIDSKGDITRREKENWVKVPGKARDLAFASDGTPWAINTNRATGGFGVSRWDGKAWQEVKGAGGMRIAVDSKGAVWVTNSRNEVYRREKDVWEKVTGTGQAVGAGGDASVWVVGTNRTQGGFGICRWDGKGWAEVDGGGSAIAVDEKGKPWVVNTANEIYRRK
jgi:hypothetical protein